MAEGRGCSEDMARQVVAVLSDPGAGCLVVLCRTANEIGTVPSATEEMRRCAHGCTAKRLHGTRRRTAAA